MATSTGSCSEEGQALDSKVQKNTAADGKEPVADEPARSSIEPTTATKKKKKILREVPASEVRYVMNYKSEPYKPNISDEMIKRFPKMAATLYIMFAETAPVVESNDRWMLEQKEDFTQQLKAKGV